MGVQVNAGAFGIFHHKYSSMSYPLLFQRLRFIDHSSVEFQKLPIHMDAFLLFYSSFQSNGCVHWQNVKNAKQLSSPLHHADFEDLQVDGILVVDIIVTECLGIG